MKLKIFLCKILISILLITHSMSAENYTKGEFSGKVSYVSIKIQDIKEEEMKINSNEISMGNIPLTFDKLKEECRNDENLPCNFEEFEKSIQLDQFKEFPNLKTKFLEKVNSQETKNCFTLIVEEKDLYLICAKSIEEGIKFRTAVISILK